MQSLKYLGSDAMIYKIDISWAFRYVGIDLRGSIWCYAFHTDGMLLFGFRHGSVSCMDAVPYIMDTFGYPNLYNYIDDLAFWVTSIRL